VPNKEAMGPNFVFFLISGAQFISILIPYLFGKKYMAAYEFITPLFAVCFLIIVIPTFAEAPKTSTYMAKATLLQTVSIGYLMLMNLSFFYSATYIISFASRSVLCLSVLYLVQRRWISGDAPVFAANFNWILSVVMFELNAYNMNRK
jgi:hypothetical protein